MRILNQHIWNAETLSGPNYSASYNVQYCYAGSIQISWGASSGGTLVLQASLDNTIWTDIPETQCDVTAAANSILWNLNEIHYPYIRLKADIYEDTLVTALIFMKGG